jgi:D-mannonate dehydratase
MFSGDINMKLGVNKCKIIEIVKGKHKEGQEYPLKEGGTITNMSENETYKYLGIGQNARITHEEIKDRVTKECKQCLNKILKTILNSRNMIRAINTCAVPVLTYMFGTIQWSDTELEQLNRLTEVALTKARAHHPRNAVERLYLP